MNDLHVGKFNMHGLEEYAKLICKHRTLPLLMPLLSFKRLPVEQIYYCVQPSSVRLSASQPTVVWQAFEHVYYHS